ncbi:hypothetical protein NMR99_003880 [Vibrio navarrensis]|nr:hypothetical protein [Vibrio navarrensis]
MTSHFSSSRRTFLKHGGVAIGVGAAQMTGMSMANGHSLHGKKTLASNPLGFNGQRQDPVTGMYPLGQGYRQYSPRLMRFNAYDSLSPFGQGGLNGYAYCLGDPINQQDPSGHFGLLSLLIGMTVGAIVGAGVSAAAEGIQTAVTGDEYDWKKVGFGAALGAISGGFGAIAEGAETSVKVGLAVADSVASASADFGLEVATGTPVKEAAISAGVGAFIGLGAFGAGYSVSKVSRANWERSLGNETLGHVEFYREEFTSCFKPKAKVAGYTDNFMNKGEEAIRTHHENGKLVSGFKGSDGSLYREVDDFLVDLRAFGVDLYSSSTGRLHLLTCGSQTEVAQVLANKLNREVVGYSKGNIRTSDISSLQGLESESFKIEEIAPWWYPSYARRARAKVYKPS